MLFDEYFLIETLAQNYEKSIFNEYWKFGKNIPQTIFQHLLKLLNYSHLTRNRFCDS